MSSGFRMDKLNSDRASFFIDVALRHAHLVKKEKRRDPIAVFRRHSF